MTKNPFCRLGCNPRRSNFPSTFLLGVAVDLLLLKTIGAESESLMLFFLWAVSTKGNRGFLEQGPLFSNSAALFWAAEAEEGRRGAEAPPFSAADLGGLGDGGKGGEEETSLPSFSWRQKAQIPPGLLFFEASVGYMSKSSMEIQANSRY
ncbi:DEAD box RNA helicase 1 [Striga asiatica]|uniref:DEAD box RNA helicase 1 n=1 Tax=Striga asiatica TaxID=4170 RepID=A0A5A7RH21_STRAF|nr:DEAD box RNA helicase 1 [Striga asiatica]